MMISSLILLAFIFVQISLTFSAIHFNDKSVFVRKFNEEKDARFVLNQSNETQTLDGYFLLDSGDPLKLQFEPSNNFTKDNGEQEITLILNASSNLVKLQFKYLSKKLVIDIAGNNTLMNEYIITYPCNSVCNQTLDFEITSMGEFHSFYNNQKWSADLNQTMKGEKAEKENGKEKIYFIFELPNNNTVDFIVYVSNAKSIFSPHYLPPPNPYIPNNTNEVKNYKTSIWMWILLILALAAFGIFTTFLCVRCRLSTSRREQQQPSQHFVVSTSSNDFDL